MLGSLDSAILEKYPQKYFQRAAQRCYQDIFRDILRLDLMKQECEVKKLSHCHGHLCPDSDGDGSPDNIQRRESSLQRFENVNFTAKLVWVNDLDPGVLRDPGLVTAGIC